MSVDLERQLDAYGRWIETRYAPGVRPVPPVAPEAAEPPRLIDIDTAAPRRRGSALLVASIAIVVLGLVGTVLVLRSGTAPASFSVPRDPPGPLYVLPSDGDVPISEGHAAMLLTEGVPASFGYAATAGRPVAGGYEDLVSITTPSAFDVAADWVAGRRGAFPTWTIEHEGFTIVAQDRGGRWVTVQSGPDRLDAVNDVLDHVVVGAAGEIELDSESTREIIDHAQVDVDRIETSVANWVAAIGGSRVPNVAVQTLAWGRPILLGGGRVDRIEPTTINGVRAWRAFSNDDQPWWWLSADIEQGAAVVWSHSPNRTVIVTGNVDVDTLERFAESLRQVSADEWAAALPGFERECTLQDLSLCDALPDP